jgi:hypothetical protein
MNPLIWQSRRAADARSAARKPGAVFFSGSFTLLVAIQTDGSFISYVAILQNDSFFQNVVIP